ncbi:hypothetical protein CDES_09670 [Corynebacterium deserti GIMN1.010]|uniref:Secreted protein n=1 Tax=Corynebacterium deserti GIMN1.010 TaxID=931089 RepID=A0A0M3Q9U5_9CORY|nr:hypothetical protein [Corynebacterium deserti]ALC06319.1 hypothetical protein CDES_09670 [Corynebacterium deserti GIMN1.010]
MTAGTPRSARSKALAMTLVLSTSLMLASCSSGSEDTPTEVEQSVGLAVNPARIVVENAGEGTKQVITYKDVPESEENAPAQDVTLNLSQGFAQSIVTADTVDPVAPAGGDVTTLHLPVTATTKPAEASDEEMVPATRDISLTAGDPTISDTSQAADMNSAGGFNLGIRATDSGQHTVLSFAAPVDATDQGRLLMEQYLLTFTSLPIVFPEEEIGVGATWTVDSRVTGESTLLQTVTYTLAGIDGDKVDLDVAVSQRPSMGAIEITEDENGEALETPEQLAVLNSNTTSVGSLSIDLTQPLPTSGQVSWTTRVIYGGSNNDVRVVQDSTSSVSFGDEESQISH